VAEHSRSFGRGDTLYDPWHYVPVLARKPGALRNGAPFKDWVLPAPSFESPDHPVKSRTSTCPALGAHSNQGSQSDAV
jgi:hypothetical protein